MLTRRLVTPALVALVLGVALLLAGTARGEPSPDDARAALTQAIERGKVLYAKRWVEAGKACAECHGPGPNRMRAGRLKSFPKWDKASGKLVTGQQKLNQMLTTMAKGEALPLGSDDLNALEAYVSTLR